MCKAFSCLVTREGKVIWEFGMDSHSTLVSKNRIKDDSFDNPLFARVEITPVNGDYMNPDEWELTIDERIRPKWWHEQHKIQAFKAHEEWLKILDTKLIRKPIVHPFKDIKPRKRITKKDKELLKEWASVRDSVQVSVWDSVRGSVWDSVLDSVRDSVWDSVRGSVGDSALDSVRDSVGVSVGFSVWTSVWDSACDSVWAYIGSFFNLERDEWKYTDNIKTEGYPFQCLVDLWERGLVPSFDGKTWRLHCGPNGKIIWEGNIEDMEKW